MTKMKLQKTILISVLIAVGINPLFAESKGPKLGHAVSPEEIAQWDISVFPDGEGLPEGEGDVIGTEYLPQGVYVLSLFNGRARETVIMIKN